MSDRLTLTPAQLVDLTDRKQPAAQVRVLRRRGIPFMWEKGGKVKVLVSALERHPANQKAPRPGFAAEPDFEKYERA